MILYGLAVDTISSKEADLKRRVATRTLIAVSIVGGASTTGACSAKEQVLHGELTQLTPIICVAGPRASGHCFDPSPATSTQGLKIGDCVIVRYVPTEDPTHRPRLTNMRKERCP
jgi:hypothetical protein